MKPAVKRAFLAASALIGASTSVPAAQWGRITIDGRLDDPAWNNALIWTVGDKRTSPDRFTVRVTYDESFIYFSADVNDVDVRGTHSSPGSEVFKDDAIEFFFEVDRARAKDRTPRTFEYGFSPAGGFTNVTGDGKGDGANYPGYVWPPSFKSRIEFQTVLKTATTLNDVTDRDKGFIVEARIPWSEWHVRGEDMIGRSMGFNVIKICRPEQAAPNEKPLSLATGVTFANNHNPSLWRNLYLFHPSRLTPPPRDEVRQASASSYRIDQKIVGTHYFYWYRWPDAHFWDDAAWTDDSLQDHFPVPEGVAFDSPAWHEHELRDVISAGVDFVAPVYWGAPQRYMAGRADFSILGLPPMVESLDRIAASGAKPPRVALFYDTSTLKTDMSALTGPIETLDLTSARGKDIFYRTIRDFFVLVPPRHWAMIEGRPIVVLFITWKAKHDQSTLDYVYEQFYKEFGCRPWIIRNDDWKVRTEAVTSWGGAFAGPRMVGPVVDGAVAQIGPGYDDRAVPGRTGPVCERDNGGFYEAAWRQAVRSRRNVVLIETWNEMHEATEICESREYGRQYIDLTAKYSRIFKEGLPLPPFEYRPSNLEKLRSKQGSEYASAQVVSWEPGREAGLYNVTNQKDGQGRIVSLGGSLAIRSVQNRAAGDPRYLYFRSADAYLFNTQTPVEIAVEYFDDGQGTFTLQYDSRDPETTLVGTYKETAPVEFKGSSTWKIMTWRLSDARLANRQSGQSDFRLYTRERPLVVRRIVVKKAP